MYLQGNRKKAHTHTRANVFALETRLENYDDENKSGEYVQKQRQRHRNISYKIETSCGWNCFWRQTCFSLLITWFCWTEIFTLYLCIYSVICSGWLVLVRTIMYIGHRRSLPIICHFSPRTTWPKNNVSYAILIRFDLIEFLAVFDSIFYHRKLHRLIGLTHTHPPNITAIHFSLSFIFFEHF